ncbi:MAG: FAD-dependent oxidoreductase [Actinomycetota bacterium]|nr:FAD-dependent oxidoreductase [Actinomycetota bacterium]
MEQVTCCIVGCGPAGAVLGLLLAHAGVDVLVLEKHADFLRDFRGDTIHPSTQRLIDELGLGEEFARLPLRRVSRLSLVADDGAYPVADFSLLPGPYASMVFLPQWDFLDFLTDRAEQSPCFTLRRRAEVTGLLCAGSRIAGVRYRDPDGTAHDVLADLVVAADGRTSVVRRAAGLTVREFGAPIDVPWFRLPRRADDGPLGAFGRITSGRFLAFIDRGDYWQIAFVVPKGGAGALRAQGLDAFRRTVADLVPALADRVEGIASWDDVKLLDVRVDRLRRWWRPGLLCIGDAAHAMSPVGGVRINLAIQDAVAAANRLAVPLREKRVRTSDLAAVQARRLLPTAVTQRVQRTVQQRFLEPTISGVRRGDAPAAVRLLARVPPLRALPALAVGYGVLPEHVAPHLRPAG